MLYFTLEVFCRLANQNCRHIRVMLESDLNNSSINQEYQITVNFIGEIKPSCDVRCNFYSKKNSIKQEFQTKWLNTVNTCSGDPVALTV